MKEKGFTLIELITTIVILSIISIIAVPTIHKAITSARNSSYENQISAIITGAKEWSTDQANFYQLPKSGETISVTLKELKKGGYVDSEITNTKTNKKFDDNCTKVDISYDGKRLSYKINMSTCTD